MNNFFDHLTYDINTTLQKNTESYLVESLDFLYTNRYLRRNKTLKLSCRVTAFTEDLVAHDYKVTLYNMLKTFFILNTGLLNFYRNSADYKPLVASSIAKFKYADIFYTYPNMLYHMAQDLLYRNIAIKLDPSNKQFSLPVFIKQVRSLNKLLFFSLFTNLKKISFNTPVFITYKRYKNYKFTVWYLGIKFIIYNHYATILKSFFKKDIISLQKNSKLFKTSIFNKSLAKITYLDSTFFDKSYKFNSVIRKNINNYFINSLSGLTVDDVLRNIPLGTVTQQTITAKDSIPYITNNYTVYKVFQKKFAVVKLLRKLNIYAKK
jgi:hypothetical protein